MDKGREIKLSGEGKCVEKGDIYIERDKEKDRLKGRLGWIGIDRGRKINGDGEWEGKERERERKRKLMGR